MTPSPAEPPRVGQRFGQYRIDGEIGVGGMGRVYLAHDLNLDRAVALKIVLGEFAESGAFLQRFDREAAVLARLDSPHVVSIYDHGELGGLPYIVTQYAAGGDLGRLLAARGPMPPGLAAQVCAQVADALVAAHEVGVVHRDVKPANVLLRDDRLDRLHVYLCDFGVALTEASGLTTPGALAGTWNYLAPERVEGQQGSPASDVYAVGCLLVEALTGRPPYTGSDVEVALEHVNAAVPHLPGDDEFTQRANRVLQLAMAKDPAARYPDAAALRDDLRAAAALFSTASATPLPGPLGAGGRARRSRWVPWVAAGVLVAALVAGGGVALARRGGGAGPSTTPTGAPTASPSAPGHAVPVNRGWVLGDVDGDGHGDVAWTDADRGYFRPSDGTALGTANKRRGGAQTPTLMGDVDGDGRADLVTVGGALPSLSVSVVTPTNDSPTVTVSLPGTRPSGDDSSADTTMAALADVDGDGRDDLVVASRSGGTESLWVALSQGDGRFGTASTWWQGAAAPAPSGLAVADLDGDGRDDLALLTVGYSSFDDDTSGEVRVLTSDGTALQPAGQRLDLPREVRDDYVGFGLLALADVDGDGEPELVGCSPYEPIAVVWDWDGTSFGSPHTWAYTSGVSDDVGQWSHAGLSDVDGDGRADLVLVTDDRVAVDRSTGSRFEPDPAFDTPLSYGYGDLIGTATALQPGD